MAEARVGVNMRPLMHLQRGEAEVDTARKVPQLNVDANGVVFYLPAPKYLFRLLKKWVLSNFTKAKVAFQPLPLPVVFSVITGATFWLCTSKSGSWIRNSRLANWLWTFDSTLKVTQGLNTNLRVGYLAGLFSTGVCLTFAKVQRFVVRRLLSYHGWMFEPRGKPSLKTKLWGLILSKVYVGRWFNNLDAFQPTLPTLPLPSVNATCDAYLKSIEPISTPEEVEAERKMIAEFKAKSAFKIQMWLWLKWMTSTNYISDWWLKWVYLASPDPIFINSNWFGTCQSTFHPTTIQAAKAAYMTYAMVNIRRKIDTGDFETQIASKCVPLCMAQYHNAFACTREPGIDCDRLTYYSPSESKHVAVICKGVIYKVPVISPHSGRVLTPFELQASFQAILDATKDLPNDPVEGAHMIPAFTAVRRDDWARVREQHFISHSKNKHRLAVIEKAAFCVTLDPTDDIPVTDWTGEGRRYFMGNGASLWCDKSFNLVALKSGKAGMHVEHSWADAPTLAHLMEIAMLGEENGIAYDEAGNCKLLEFDLKYANQTLRSEAHLHRPERIDFEVDKDLAEEAQTAYRCARKEMDNLQLEIFQFKPFGKSWISKQAKCSPDAFSQMAMQIAYYRDQGRFDLTYESSMTRFFKEGRTETIRPCTNDSVKFVRAFEDPKVPASEKHALLQKACETHQYNTQMCMAGHGIDRHLFAMLIVSRGKNIDAPFLYQALRGRKWKLSTSQVPTGQQCDKKQHGPGYDQGKFDTPNGGFGPVADDGYGICYNLYPHCIYYNTSAKVSAKNTDAKRFNERIHKALEDLRTMVEESNNSKK